ncbi:hypothetical protein [Calothrix sp. PCC 6303]|uniref:hypothetical protein n=1 Tax=Calothrix sp. PCC 6303 TaxID=1170562 RepID=UPI0002A02B3C|nr:hypothetical protein [Calothrix sp. PCC 6303]AFZ01685.1 hypothetical protein Cal6303_2713 [Calothrix sp. PCC 6303]
MEALKVRLNNKTLSVLSLYPEWLTMVNQAIDKPQFGIHYIPRVIEVFDQYGLLTGRINSSLSYESTRNLEQESEFIAWLLDGELAVLYVGSELVVNRLQILAIAFGELL